MGGSRRQRSIDEKEDLPGEVEKAARPIMDRAQRVKEQVTLATADVKQTVEAKAQAIRSKSERLKNVGERAAREVKEIIQIDPESQMPIVQPQQATTLRERYGLRGGRLVAVLAMLVTLIAICVAWLLWSSRK